MKKNKIVIYTAISGGLDNLIQHKYRSAHFDYVCFTDQPIPESGIWDVRLMKESRLDEVRKAKFYKMFPHELFPEYQYSIWIDGNIDVLEKDLEKRAMELISGNALIAANVHPQRNCVYEEANACIKMGKDEPGPIFRQVEFLRSVGFPENMGLYEMNIVYRKHQDHKIVQLMNDWWWMVENFSRRDQLGFMYVLYKNNISCDWLFNEDIRNNAAFSVKPHAKTFYSTLMVDTGTGFNYKNMLIQRVVVKEESSVEMTFILKKFSTIKQIRWIPFDTGIGKIRLISIILQDLENKLVIFDLQKIISNGTLQEDGFLGFQTFNPIFDMPIKGQISKIVISGVFKLANKLESELIISRELEEIHNSYSFKLGKKFFWLPRKLYALLKKIFPSISEKLNIKVG